MSTKQPADAIPDDLILAALDRALRHRSRRPVPDWVILDHLHIPRRTKEARQVRTRLAALMMDGSLEQSRAHGVGGWALTARGRRRLRRVADVALDLPESPQHQEWRSAQTLAGQEIERFRESLRATLDEAMAALDAPGTSSDDWFALKDRLERDARRIAAVTYCLHEWAEPDDARADVDDRTDPSDQAYSPEERNRRKARRAGRRNPLLWISPDAGPPDLD